MAHLASFFLTVNYGLNAYIRLREKTQNISNFQFSSVSISNETVTCIYYGSVPIPLTKLNPDFAIVNKVSHSIYGQINLRLQSEQSTSVGGLFRLVTKAGFRFPFLLDHLS